MLKASLLLSLALLLGRMSGLARELTLASIFGVSLEADMAVLLLTLPDLLVNLLISGGLSAALVPRFSALASAGAYALFRQASVAVVLLFAVVGGLFVAFPQVFFAFLAPGIGGQFAIGALGLFAIALALPLTGGSGVAAAYLNSRGRFFVSGCGTLIFNLAVLAALWKAMSVAEPLALLAVGIFVGAVIRWGAQIAALPKGISRAEAHLGLIDRTLMRAFCAATLAAGLMLIAPVLIRAMASTLGAGAIASFNYAQKLVELPVAILVTSISTVALPRLSSMYAVHKSADAHQSAVRDVQYALLIAVPVAVLGIHFADSVVNVLFGRGEMGGEALQRVTGLTRIALLGVPAIAISSMASAVLNAQNSSGQVLKATLGSLVLLPLLALPGLMLSSEAGLMAAVVAFQVIVAVWLAHLAKLPFFGRGSILSGAGCEAFVRVLVLAGLFAAIDAVTKMDSSVLRLAIAGTGFGIVLCFPVRRFARSNPHPTFIPQVL
ncbi:MAG: hypothetical protein JWQ80_449 [Massilia sp.]|nr:hypothetical protein [Massilia sp.]